MDAVRYVIAMLVVVAFPAAMSMWFVIHPFAAFWRRRGPLVTYGVVIVVAISIAAVLYRVRDKLLGTDFGFNWWLSAVGLICLALAILLERQYRKEIKVATLLGFPEVSTSAKREMLTEGIYSRIRHPRYVGLMLEILAFALFINYLGAYLVVLAMVPILYLTVRLEERELLARFGDSYAEYMRRVPRFLPRGSAREPNK